jgi:hypothetical protein
VYSEVDWNPKTYAEAIDKDYPDMAAVIEVRDRVLLGKPHSGMGDYEVYGADASKSEKVLGLKYRPLEESVIDGARPFLSLELAT